MNVSLVLYGLITCSTFDYNQVLDVLSIHKPSGGKPNKNNEIAAQKMAYQERSDFHAIFTVILYVLSYQKRQ